MLNKLKSRKFLVTLLTNIIAIATMFTNNSNETIKIIAMIVISISNILYAVVEGSIDIKNITNVINDVNTSINTNLKG